MGNSWVIDGNFLMEFKLEMLSFLRRDNMEGSTCISLDFWVHFEEYMMDFPIEILPTIDTSHSLIPRRHNRSNSTFLQKKHRQNAHSFYYSLKKSGDPKIIIIIFFRHKKLINSCMTLKNKDKKYNEIVRYSTAS